MNRSYKALTSVAAGALLLAGCDVTNPGPVQQEFLAQPESHAALVAGAGRRLAEGLNSIAYTSALISREIYPGGTTGSLGHSPLEQAGYIEPGGDPGQGSFYNDMIQARFISEEALAIFAGSSDPVDPDVEALAHIFAGFSYRIIAENWCETVFSTESELGGLEASTARLSTGKQHFTDAIGLADDDDLVLAAYAGRAQINMWMDDWTAALADAQYVIANADAGWSFDLNMDDLDPETRNQLWFANADAPYRAYSMLFTFYGGNDGVIAQNSDGDALPQFVGYSWEVDDPRVPVTLTDKQYASFAVQGFGQVPFINQDKYKDGDQDIRLAGTPEMHLIVAEAALNGVGGDWATAMGIIDDLRASYGLNNLMVDFPDAALPAATNTATAMSYLMRERGLELWGEGRRWGDQRRWFDGADGLGQGLGGDQMLADFESTSSLFRDPATPRSICSDVPDSERNSNPNVPSAQAG
jgi:hypothetical protein